MLIRARHTIWISLLILAYLFALVAVPVVLFLLLTYPDREPLVCDRPVMTFANTEYRIELCFRVNFDHGEERGRLRVYAINRNSLLAQRDFLILRDSRLGEIEYLDTGIRYTDATKTQNIDLPEEKFLQFPPTRWDWLTANLVRLTYDP
ncbi:hypothetical protein SAMN05216345_102446 [Cupriavidus sp. YR651]|uniref:hypothetical protein n=1 Tax=Cupriavidus sp. YR651 TaxID=1855315 RepID=UPI0008812C0B|nr:hypothetical protein [Cupriavidus sp. YR651]SDC47624.1 hypothetical protein SAMN05216345_102446 [Cupriavidus sp. YR651]